MPQEGRDYTGTGGENSLRADKLEATVSQPSDDDQDLCLFRDAVRDVKPLNSPPSPPQPPKPRPAARFTRADQQTVLEESLHDERADRADPALAGGDELVFQRPGVRPSVLRKLRRGGYRVQGEIDLHGLTVAEARPVLREFLAHALASRWRCVRIVHGKGLRSGNRGPKLKGLVGSTLRRLDPVVAYVSARPVDGGSGAIYVLLSE